MSVPGSGELITYSYAQRAPGVIIVPVTVDGKVALIRQYRFPVDEWCWEIPAGTTVDTGNMPLEEVVRKELEEEIGATAERVERVAQFLTAPAYCTELCHVFIAWGVRFSCRPKPERTEKTEVELVAAAEALQRAQNGRIQNGACALAVCQARAALAAAESL